PKPLPCRVSCIPYTTLFRSEAGCCREESRARPRDPVPAAQLRASPYRDACHPARRGIPCAQHGRRSGALPWSWSSDPEWTSPRSLRRHAPLASVAPPHERSMDMADQINVTERSHSPWPWIIGVIVLAILIWAIAQMGSNDNPDVQID